MDPEEIRKLHRICVKSLRDYIPEAQNTCTLLEKMDDFPVPLGVWISATEQRNAEYHAQERYRLIREQIFDALRPAARASRRKT